MESAMLELLLLFLPGDAGWGPFTAKHSVDEAGRYSPAASLKRVLEAYTLSIRTDLG
jgi:hypothetical protein